MKKGQRWYNSLMVRSRSESERVCWWREKAKEKERVAASMYETIARRREGMIRQCGILALLLLMTGDDSASSRWSWCKTSDFLEFYTRMLPDQHRNFQCPAASKGTQIGDVSLWCLWPVLSERWTPCRPSGAIKWFGACRTAPCDATLTTALRDQTWTFKPWLVEMIAINGLSLYSDHKQILCNEKHLREV